MPKILIVLFIGLGFNSIGQIEEVRRITEQLCAPEFHGRGYYKKGDSLAADYIVSEFEKLGVKGYKRKTLQHFEIESINAFPGAMNVNQKGETLTPGIHYVVHPSSAGFKGELKPIHLGVEVMLDIAKLRPIMMDFQNGNTEANAMVLHLAGLSKDTLQRLAGISQALSDFAHVIELTDAKFTWSVGREQLPHAIIQIQDSIYLGESLEVNIEADLIESYQSQNVIAYIPGKKKCGPTIMFTAHYDHLGRMGDDIYFPGANDNASGTAMLLTMAKYFKENPSDYNIMFVAFAGEEAGLLGSKYFTENPILKLKKIKFLINLDIMGSGEEGITAVNATLFEEEFELLQKINEEKNLLAKVKKRGPTSNSDHYWFTEKGVPAFFIYTMGPNKHYHDIFDKYEALSFKEYEDITTLLIEFVKRLK